jgi:hypothetical protein
MIPLICSVERMKAGGDHFAFDPEVPCHFGVLPRYGAKGEDVKVRNSTAKHSSIQTMGIRMKLR